MTLTRLRSTLWPVPVPVAAAVFAGVLAAALLRSWSQIDALVADWATLSSEAREGLAFAGPIAGMGALWVAARFNSRRGLLVPIASARAGAPVVARQLLVVWVVATVALATGLAPAVIDAGIRATAGRPDLLVIASALPTLAAYVALGHLIGTALPPVPALAGGFITLFGMVLVGSMAGPRWWAVTPVWTWGSAEAGFFENPLLTGFRIAFFAACGLCFARAAGVWVERRSLSALRHSAAGLTMLMIPALMVSLAAARPVHSIVRDLAPPKVCEQVAGVDVCVHAAHQPLLGDLVGVVRTTLAAAGPDLSSRVTRVVDASLLTEPQPPGELVIGLQIFDKQRWPSHAASDIALRLSGHDRCHWPDGIEDPQHPVILSSGLWQWIYIRSGYVAPELLRSGWELDVAERLDETAPELVHQWIAAHLDPILACELTPEMLP